MKKINRRAFLGKSAIGVGAALTLSQIPTFMAKASPKINMPIGFQTFPIRDMLAKDFGGTLKTMAGFGYKICEMCSPPGYLQAGFSFLEHTKAADIKKTINDAGLSCPSCHFTFTELNDKLDQSIDFAHELGLSQMVCSSFWLPATATIKDYQDACDKLNKAAVKIKAAGFEAGFHNHDMEFKKVDGVLIYDAILDRLDANLVKMQFQTQVITLGFKAADYFTKYPGRFISSHLSDWTADKKEAIIGQGIIDWKEYFGATKKGGIKNIFVEMGFEKFKDSAAYIKSL
ncbi:MAG TPA: sugar phosphate isomerase/epimerase [Puia sp.]|nr:sugar phosphate isomerase/epimerase [Puia sp.]